MGSYSRGALEGAYYLGNRFDPLEKRNFVFSIFLLSSLFFYLGLFFEMTHEPSSLEEGTLAEDDSDLPCP